jgi:hypothetical protein
VTLIPQRLVVATVAAGLSLLLVICRPVSAQEASRSAGVEEFSFDIEEFAKSPWSLDGYLQGNVDYAGLDRDAALYRLGFLGQEEDAYRLQGGVELQAGLTFQQGPFKAYALGMLQQSHDGEEWHDDALLYEGNLSWQVSSNAYVTVGKTLLRWGKGYVGQGVRLEPHQLRRPEQESIGSRSVAGRLLGGACGHREKLLRTAQDRRFHRRAPAGF